MDITIKLCDNCRREMKRETPLPNIYPNRIPKVCDNCLFAVRKALQACSS